MENLIEYLVGELGISKTQAEGGAGLLLSFAQDRLGHAEFIEIADTVPAISDIIGKAPRLELPAPQPLRAVMSRWFGGLGGLSVLAKAFEGLGVDKVMIGDMVGAVQRFFGEQGGSGVESHLRGVFR